MNDKQTDKRRTLRELLILAVGEGIVLGVMFGIYALLGKLTAKVLLGGAVGALITVLNYFLMALGVWSASAKAEQGDPAGGRRVITLSMIGRYLLMIAVLVAGAKSGLCEVVAMVVPLALFRILLFAAEFFRGKEG